MADIADVSSPLMDELSALGPIFGIVLILGGVFLMLRGHERLQYVACANPNLVFNSSRYRAQRFTSDDHPHDAAVRYYAHDHTNEHLPHGFDGHLHHVLVDLPLA